MSGVTPDITTNVCLPGVTSNVCLSGVTPDSLPPDTKKKFIFENHMTLIINKFLSKISERKPLVFGILLAFALICYVNVIDGPMLFDDEHFIEKNLLIQSLDNIPDIFTTSVTEGAYIGSNFYRPNQQVVYAFLYHFFGLNPVAYHLVSILLHLLNAFFIFLLLVRFSFSKNASFIAALLFLVHPVQVEAVSYISGLADPLGLFLLLLGLLSYHKGLMARKRTSQWTRFVLSLDFFYCGSFYKRKPGDIFTA